MAVKKLGKKGGFAISVTGFDVTLRTLKLSKNQRNRLEAFVQKECDKVIDHAQEIVPFDEGDLHDTHRREKIQANRTGVVYRVIAGGISGPNKFVGYASKVHDREPWLKEAADYELVGYQERAVAHLKWVTGSKKVSVLDLSRRSRNSK
jgi:hypothetical protein